MKRGYGIGIVARVLKIRGQELTKFFIVFDNQEPHPN